MVLNTKYDTNRKIIVKIHKLSAHGEIRVNFKSRKRSSFKQLISLSLMNLLFYCLVLKIHMHMCILKNLLKEFYCEITQLLLGRAFEESICW